MLAKSVLLGLTLPLGSYRGLKYFMPTILEVKSVIRFNLGSYMAVIAQSMLNPAKPEDYYEN